MGFEEMKGFLLAEKALLVAFPCSGLTDCLGICFFS